MHKGGLLISTFAGVLLILAGLLIPSDVLINTLRTIPPELGDELMLGAALFRLALVLMGLVILILPRLPIWSPGIKTEKEKIRSRSKVWLVAALLLAALALRLYDLNLGMWLDEILTYVNYAPLPYGQIITTFDSENQHFLFTILAHTSFIIFGESTWALRLPAVLFGVASIWALFLLGREVASEREGILAAALVTFSYHHVWFSQNARGYTGLLFWTLLASWLFVRGLKENSSRVWLGYAIASALGVYTHLTMVFVIIGHFVIYIAAIYVRRRSEWPRRWIGFFVGFVLAGFFTFFLHALVIPQILGTIGGSEVSVVAEWKNPLWTALELFRGLEIGFTGGVMAVGALILLGAGLVSYWKSNPVVLGLLIFPATIGAAATVAIGHHLWPRFFFFAMGFGALVVIRGLFTAGALLERLIKIPNQYTLWVGTALCMGLILVSALSVPFAYAPKQDYAGALRYIEANGHTGDAIVTVNLTVFVYQDYYHMDWPEVTSADGLNSVMLQSNQTWMVYTFPTVLESVYPDVMAMLQRDFTIVGKYGGTVGDGTVFVARAGKPAVVPTNRLEAMP